MNGSLFASLRWFEELWLQLLFVGLCWLLGTINWLWKLPPNWKVSVRLVCGLKLAPPEQKCSRRRVIGLGATDFSPFSLMLMGYHLPLLLFRFYSWMYHSEYTPKWRQMLWYVGEHGVRTTGGICLSIFSCYHSAREKWPLVDVPEEFSGRSSIDQVSMRSEIDGRRF